MRLKRAFLLPLAGLGAGTLLLALLSPALVVGGIRGWLWWTARQQNLAIDCENVDAPLFRPAVLEGLRVRTQPDAPLALELDVVRAEVAFNLGALFGRSEARAVRDLAVAGATVKVHQIAPAEAKSAAPSWAVLRDLLADSFRISELNVHVENGATRVDVRGISLTASELESGALLIGDVSVASPLLTRSFASLRGVASWQNNRITLGALSLTRGIDIDAISADLAHLSSGRVDLELRLEAFGGRLRADITSDHRAGRVWNVAGSASGISLAQMSGILGWHGQATGSVRACKFTFRGDAATMADSTASVWTEISQFTWRERSADLIMFGASLYNQRVHVEQIYVKQHKNELTISGDSVLPGDGSFWPVRDFTGHISASIPDADAFARLLGAERSTYSGDISIEASIGIEGRALRGGLTTAGELRLTDAMFGPALRMNAHVTCHGPTATIENADIFQGENRLGLRGEIDLADITALRVSLVPTERLVNLTPASVEDCLGAITLAPAPPSDPPAAGIEQLEIRGALFAREWELSLRPAGDGLPPAEDGAPPQPQTYRLCLRGTDVPGELRLGIGAPPQP